MDNQKIKRLGRAAFSRSIHPLSHSAICSFPLVGFDTEYTSKGNELISFQLHDGEHGLFTPVKRGEKLTPLKLYQGCCKLLHNNPPDVLLISFFSIAELQFLPVQSEGINIREFNNGSLDVTFYKGLDNARLHVFDISRFFVKQGLGDVARSFGLEKLDVKRDSVTRKNLKDKEFIRYAINDAFLCVEIARQLRTMFIENTGVDPITYKTAAGTSQAVFRRKYVKDDMYCDSNPARLAALRGYRGGHAEVFRRGKLKGMFTEYDLISAYPTAAVKIREFPIQGSWREFFRVREIQKFKGGFALVRFRFPSDFQYPFLPVDVKDSTLFPTAGETWSTLWEIDLAREYGAEIELVEGWGYKTGTRCLGRYFRWTMEQRKTAKGVLCYMYKLLGNSLYGKFVQCIEKIDIDKIAEIAEKGGYLFDDVLDCSYQEQMALIQALNISLSLDDKIKIPVSVGSVFMPEWAGLITGYVRAALAEMLVTGRGVYCHTDSVWSLTKPRCRFMAFDEKVRGNVVIIRRAFASIGKPPTPENVRAGKTHAAIHSIWSLAAGCAMLSRFDGSDFQMNYPIKRPIKYRESLRSKHTKKFGVWAWENRKGSTAWDDKRRLLPGGDTLPWKNVQEYMENRGNPDIIKDGELTVWDKGFELKPLNE